MASAPPLPLLQRLDQEQRFSGLVVTQSGILGEGALPAEGTGAQHTVSCCQPIGVEIAYSRKALLTALSNGLVPLVSIAPSLISQIMVPPYPLDLIHAPLAAIEVGSS